MGKLNKSNGVKIGGKNQGDYTDYIGEIKFFPSSSPLYRFFVGNFFDKFLYNMRAVKSYKSPLKYCKVNLLSK